MRRNMLEMRRTTSREKLGPVEKRDYWYVKTLSDAFNNDSPHRELMVVRPTHNSYAMNGYEYTLCNYICYSKRAGNVAKDAGYLLSDVVPFDRVKAVNKKCLSAFL